MKREIKVKDKVIIIGVVYPYSVGEVVEVMKVVSFGVISVIDSKGVEWYLSEEDYQLVNSKKDKLKYIFLWVALCIVVLLFTISLVSAVTFIKNL